ncbi:hypothetical protein LR48_Vigan05g027800 [Vigna angularis]|uniref:Uncharacterized protein n=1 Tax=Phaseolus angularis TaxID=3914 RepID=A0A0L9UJD4_PHAAN|nr:hypothetical protein LR48_Vigan05g027800 [Vigna angularis]
MVRSKATTVINEGGLGDDDFNRLTKVQPWMKEMRWRTMKRCDGVGHDEDKTCHGWR